MLKSQRYYLEYALTIFFFTQGYYLLDLPRWMSLLFFFTIIFIKYITEGWRMNFPLWFIAQFVHIITRGIPGTLLSTAIAIFAIKYFPIFQYRPPTGKYRVGYKTLKVDGVDVAVFYPTTEISRDVKYYPCPNHWERFYDIMLYDEPVKKYVPRYFFKFALSYLPHRKMGVNGNARIKKERTREQFPAIVFSGGLSANKHVYVTHMKEWASRGFICFNLDHDE